MLTVWGRTNSINVQKVLWCCEELAIPYRRIDAGANFGMNKTASYLALNPNGLVPLIEDDGFYLWESNVIVRYLSTKHGGGLLCPTDIRARFDGERWMDWQATVLWPVLRTVFLTLVRTPEPERNLTALKDAQDQCAQAMTILNAQLAGRTFVGGDRFSMADIPAGVSAHRWYALIMSRPELPHLRRWYDLLATRAPFQKAVMLPLS